MISNERRTPEPQHGMMPPLVVFIDPTRNLLLPQGKDIAYTEGGIHNREGPPPQFDPQFEGLKSDTGVGRETGGGALPIPEGAGRARTSRGRWREQEQDRAAQAGAGRGRQERRRRSPVGDRAGGAGRWSRTAQGAGRRQSVGRSGGVGSTLWIDREDRGRRRREQDRPRCRQQWQGQAAGSRRQRRVRAATAATAGIRQESWNSVRHPSRWTGVRLEPS